MIMVDRYIRTRNVKLNRGLVELPHLEHQSYPNSDTYLLEQVDLNGYRYLFIFPKDDLNKENLRIRDPIVSLLPESVDLERIVNENGSFSFQMPKSSLQYLGLRRNSWAIVFVNVHGHIFIVNPKDFELRYNVNEN